MELIVLSFIYNLRSIPLSFVIINNMIAVTVDIKDPAFDRFLTESAMNEFREQRLAANIMQLLGLYQGLIYNFILEVYIFLQNLPLLQLTRFGELVHRIQRN